MLRWVSNFTLMSSLHSKYGMYFNINLKEYIFWKTGLKYGKFDRHSISARQFKNKKKESVNSVYVVCISRTIGLWKTAKQEKCTESFSRQCLGQLKRPPQICDTLQVTQRQPCKSDKVLSNLIFRQSLRQLLTSCTWTLLRQLTIFDVKAATKMSVYIVLIQNSIWMIQMLKLLMNNSLNLI